MHKLLNLHKKYGIIFLTADRLKYVCVASRQAGVTAGGFIMNRNENIRKLTVLAMLTALIVVVQVICTMIKFGPFSITLALTPIVIGAALYGPAAGAFLGFVFSLVVYITGLMAMDGGFILMMINYSAIGTTFICLFKGTAAGFVAGWLYRIIGKKSKTAASIVTSVAAPIVNTGLFALAMMTIFYGFLSQNTTADYTNPIGMLFLSWIGVNFIVEFISNVALAGVITRVVEYSQSGKRR